MTCTKTFVGRVDLRDLGWNGSKEVIFYDECTKTFVGRVDLRDLGSKEMTFCHDVYKDIRGSRGFPILDGMEHPVISARLTDQRHCERCQRGVSEPISERMPPMRAELESIAFHLPYANMRVDDQSQSGSQRTVRSPKRSSPSLLASRPRPRSYTAALIDVRHASSATRRVVGQVSHVLAAQPEGTAVIGVDCKCRDKPYAVNKLMTKYV
ncbi:hypothetical protein J6590_077447 [Homalodisca vitripennis]|nr:hypothetical protein J6590_077447 [Homalodisca vitripennis]